MIHDPTKDSGLVKGLAPSDAEKAEHLPRDEAALRALRLGRDVERIVELFHFGVLVRAAGFGGGAYGFFDLNGELRQFGRSESRRLNGEYYDVKPGICLIAYDPRSLAHVIFESRGPALPLVSPLSAQPTTAELNSVEALLSAAADRFDDVAALHVISDRLIELQDPHGKLMQVQLSRELGAPYREGEQWLISSQWIPGGLARDSVRFERGLLYSGTCNAQVTLRHFGWQTIRALHFPLWEIAEPSPFATDLPRLRQLSGIYGKDFERLLPRFPRSLEVLQCASAQMHHVRLLLGVLHEFPALHTLGFERLLSRRPIAALKEVLSHRPPLLSSLWIGGRDYDSARAVQRSLSRAPGLTVNLHFVTPAYPGDLVWVAVTPSGLSLHQRGNPSPYLVQSARELMIKSGIADPQFGPAS